MRRRCFRGGAPALLALALLAPATARTADAPRADGASAAGKAAAPATTPFGLVAFDSGEPISIRSGELEALTNGGERELRFKGDVEVEQADIRITADYLEAFYPQGASQPDRLVAEGHVVLTQRKPRKVLRASCDRASYDRPGRLLVCRGNAQVEDGGSRVRGRTIEFDLAREVMKVKGGAVVLIQPDGREAGAADGTPAPGGVGG